MTSEFVHDDGVDGENVLVDTAGDFPGHDQLDPYAATPAPTDGAPESTLVVGEEKKKKKKKKKKHVEAPAEAGIEADAAEPDSPSRKRKAQPADESAGADTADVELKEEPAPEDGDQTWQEEESAQALLALNKGVDGEPTAAGEEPPPKKKKKKKSKKTDAAPVPTEDPAADPAGAESLLPPAAAEDTVNIEHHDPSVYIPSSEAVQMAEAALAATTAHMHATGALDIADSLEQQQQQQGGDTQRVVMSEHLAAHMSKLPPAQQQEPQHQQPEYAAMNDDMLLEQRLAAQLQQNGFQTSGLETGYVVEDMAAAAEHVGQQPGEPQKKRKRQAEMVLADGGLMVDPQLMQLDEDAAMALGEAEKAKKRRTDQQEMQPAPVVQPAQSPADDAAKKSAARKRSAEKKTNWGTATTDGVAPQGGTFGVHERFAIDKALMDFSKANGMTMEQLGERVWGNNRPKDEFWDTICRAVPNRSRASVYKHVRRSCHIFQQRAKWTEEEDAELAALVAEKGNKWKDIGLAMHRMGEDCRDRYRNYVKCGKNRGTDRWSEEEEELLKATVAAHKEVARQMLIAEGKPLPPPEQEDQVLINWTVVSDKMDNKRSRIQCRYKWKKMLAQKERVQKAPVGVTYEGGKRKRIAYSIERMLPGDHYWLLKEIQNSGAQAENEIPWDHIAKNDKSEAAGIWTHKDLKAMYKKLRINQPHTRRPLSEIVRVLLTELESSALDLTTRFNPATTPDPSAAPYHQPSLTPQPYPPPPPQQQYLKQPAPIAQMSAAPDLALDPELMNQGGLHELEKTAGEAIAFSAALQSAARVARGAVQQQQQQQQQRAQQQAQQAGMLLEEDDNERELRKQLGGFIQQQEGQASSV